MEQRGLTIPLKQADLIPTCHKLWENNHYKFVVCLIKEQVCEGFPNNLSELLAHVQNRIYHQPIFTMRKRMVYYGYSI